MKVELTKPESFDRFLSSINPEDNLSKEEMYEVSEYLFNFIFRAITQIELTIEELENLQYYWSDSKYLSEVAILKDVIYMLKEV